MSQFKERKRDKLKRIIKSGVQKLAKVTESRIARRFIPLFGLIAIIRPGKALAFPGLPDAEALQFGKDASFMAAEYKGMREVVRTGVGAIPDPTLRTAVSTAGSLASLVAGVSCGVGSAICTGLGYEQKAVVCLHGVAVCGGIASGLYEADPANPVTLPGKLAGDAIADKV